ncbi:hypothetical protein ACPUYX_01000 [Desulfosporosinus sp. SYSU MS00001]|uniref:hypothetical protein n=1 Tax=Desulfosporosinus sp. SYSU MS00001 TaxID=3416284 RepID=UPI003CEF2E09
MALWRRRTSDGHGWREGTCEPPRVWGQVAFTEFADCLRKDLALPDTASLAKGSSKEAVCISKWNPLLIRQDKKYFAAGKRGNLPKSKLNRSCMALSQQMVANLMFFSKEKSL